MKNDSTPSEGWEGATRQCVEANIYSGDSNLQKIDYIMAHIGTVLKHEISKARQEVYDEMECGWDICLTNAQYERCVEVQVKKARQETRQEIKEWVESYNKRSDGINKSDLLKKLEEEK